MSTIVRFLLVAIILCRPAFSEMAESPTVKGSRDAMHETPEWDESAAQSTSARGMGAQSSGGGENVGTDIKQFGEQVAKRVDRIIRKNAFTLWDDPWTFQGIPIILPSPSSGFNLGIKINFQNIKRQDPHKLEVETQVLASDKGRYKHLLKVDWPHAFDGKFRITGRLAYDRDITFRYYGLGNDTLVDNAGLDADNPLYQNIRAGPTFTLQLLRHLGHHVRAGPVVGLRWTDISAPPGSLLEQERPVGINGGRTHFFGLAIVHDTLDFEPYPSRGSFHELYFNIYNAAFTASNYDFYRATYTYRRYHLLHRRLIFAHRTLFEALGGQVPYYELGAVGGSNPTIGLGGDRYFRGYDSNRFIDYLRFVMGFELRWDPLFFGFAKQDITVGFVPFFDFGRVWPAVFPIDISRFHASMGWGVRLIWNSRFVIRSDFAVTPEGTSVIINLGNSF